MNKEDELQNKIEAGKSAETADELAYKFVFKSLAKEPDTFLPPSFADKVILRIEKQKSESSALEYFLAVFGGITMIVGFVATLVLTKFKFDLGFLNSLNNFKGLFLFGIAFIIILNVLDKRLFRKKEFV